MILSGKRKTKRIWLVLSTAVLMTLALTAAVRPPAVLRKTANNYFNREYVWDIRKTASATSLVLSESSRAAGKW